MNSCVWDEQVFPRQREHTLTKGNYMEKGHSNRDQHTQRVGVTQYSWKQRGAEEVKKRKTGGILEVKVLETTRVWLWAINTTKYSSQKVAKINIKKILSFQPLQKSLLATV